MSAMKYIFKILLLLCASALPGTMSLHALSGQEVRFHNEGADTTAITRLLTEASAMTFANPEARNEFFARKFIGKPYVAHTLECDTAEILTVNLDELDCTTFVETVLALSYTVGERRSSWRDFVYNLRRMRYRGGETDGYASRLHYICDWAVDNIHRGNITDATDAFPRFNYLVRTIDFMSANRGKYPALADSANFARIRSVEDGYRSHRFPYIKSMNVDSKEISRSLRSGDVVALVSNLKNLDVTHMGIVVREPDGEFHLLHASSSDRRIEITKRPLGDFLKKNRQWLGIRVFRLTE